MTFPSDTGYVPGQKVRLRVTLADPNAARWGFQLTARLASATDTGEGTFSVVDGDAAVQVEQDSNGVQHAMHTGAGTRRGTRGQTAWEVDWSAPDAGAGAVTFYVAGNAANGDGNDTGDSIYTASLLVKPVDAVIPTRAIPQLMFGDGWSTVIYLASTSDNALSLNVRFFGDDGQPLTVPLTGTDPASSVQLNLPAHGSGVVEVPSSGSLTQGWALIDFPQGLTGYGLLRRTADSGSQEVIVPLSSTTSARSVFAFDEIASTTAVTAVNPGDPGITAIIIARDDQGQPIGSPLQATLPARGRASLVLKDRDELKDIAGRRGTIEVSTTAGMVSAVGLRSGPTTLTPLPAAEQ